MLSHVAFCLARAIDKAVSAFHVRQHMREKWNVLSHMRPNWHARQHVMSALTSWRCKFFACPSPGALADQVLQLGVAHALPHIASLSGAARLPPFVFQRGTGQW